MEDGGLRFEDVTDASGIAALGYGVGVATGDYDGDGWTDLYVTNLGSNQASLPFTGFGTGFIDYDNDGWLDLVAVNGAVRLLERQASQGEPHPFQQRKLLLFHNSGRGVFEDVSLAAGPAFALDEVSRSTAFGDVDNDGDTDLVVFNNSGPARLLLNAVGSRQHWLGLSILNESGAPALLARVSADPPEGMPLWRRVHTDGSYCSAGGPRVLIGLGAEASPRTIRVAWPDGRRDEYPGLAVDRYWTLRPGRPPEDGL